MFTDTTTVYLSSLVADSTPKAKPLAKSLHTVTVLVNVAKHLRHGGTLDATVAVQQAADILGLGGMPDSYGLIAQAVKKVSKG